jgi:hypothetical protein
LPPRGEDQAIESKQASSTDGDHSDHGDAEARRAVQQRQREQGAERVAAQPAQEGRRAGHRRVPRGGVGAGGRLLLRAGVVGRGARRAADRGRRRRQPGHAAAAGGGPRRGVGAVQHPAAGAEPAEPHARQPAGRGRRAGARRHGGRDGVGARGVGGGAGGRGGGRRQPGHAAAARGGPGHRVGALQHPPAGAEPAEPDAERLSDRAAPFPLCMKKKDGSSDRRDGTWVSSLVCVPRVSELLNRKCSTHARIFPLCFFVHVHGDLSLSPSLSVLH